MWVIDSSASTTGPEALGFLGLFILAVCFAPAVGVLLRLKSRRLSRPRAYLSETERQLEAERRKVA